MTLEGQRLHFACPWRNFIRSLCFWQNPPHTTHRNILIFLFFTKQKTWQRFRSQHFPQNLGKLLEDGFCFVIMQPNQTTQKKNLAVNLRKELFFAAEFREHTKRRS